MSQTKFIQIFKENQNLYQDLLPEWIAYLKNVFPQLRKDDEKEATAEERTNDLNRRINIQGKRPDMHFELFYYDDTLIGFSNFAIDTGGISGLIPKGYGTIMEFYISPKFRRKGYGKLFYEHIEETLKKDGAQYMYLTSDTAEGVPFWCKMGFIKTDKIAPDNKDPIFIKNI